MCYCTISLPSKVREIYFFLKSVILIFSNRASRKRRISTCKSGQTVVLISISGDNFGNGALIDVAETVDWIDKENFCNHIPRYQIRYTLVQFLRFNFCGKFGRIRRSSNEASKKKQPI